MIIFRKRYDKFKRVCHNVGGVIPAPVFKPTTKQCARLIFSIQ